MKFRVFFRVCLYWNEDHFDSYGLSSLHQEIRTFIANETKHWTYNQNCYQGYSTDISGQYCVYFFTPTPSKTQASARFVVSIPKDVEVIFPSTRSLCDYNGLERLANLKEIKDKLANVSGKISTNCCYCWICSFLILKNTKNLMLFIFFVL